VPAKTLFIAAWSLLWMPPLQALAADSALAATITQLQPHVECSSLSASARTLKLGTALQVGDKVKTSGSGALAFLMADGSMVKLGPNTEMTLAASRADSKGENIFELVRGLFQAVVSKQGDGSFSVRTPAGVAAVKGTKWQIDAFPERSEVKVLSGTVEVKAATGAETVLVQAGEGTTTFKDRVQAVRKLDKAEVDAMKAAFGQRVFQAKQDYSDRVKKLNGN
jgi:hypothetical protein